MAATRLPVNSAAEILPGEDLDPGFLLIQRECAPDHLTQVIP